MKTPFILFQLQIILNHPSKGMTKTTDNTTTIKVIRARCKTAGVTTATALGTAMMTTLTTVTTATATTVAMTTAMMNMSGGSEFVHQTEGTSSGVMLKPEC